jgi:uncharacterized metal-binding protein
VKKSIPPQCAQCESKECRDGMDCFSQDGNHRQLYQNSDIAELHRAASTIEARYYGKETRLGEVILLAKQLGYQKIGLAFCIGLSDEAKIIAEILSKHFKVVSVCCKVCGIDKKDFDLPQILPERQEVMCNPAGQAQLLNEERTHLNVLCGLCVGHDAIFTKVSDAPVTTLIAKDRVLAHNPAGAIYSRYIRKQLKDTA